MIRKYYIREIVLKVSILKAKTNIKVNLSQHTFNLHFSILIFIFRSLEIDFPNVSHEYINTIFKHLIYDFV